MGNSQGLDFASGRKTDCPSELYLAISRRKKVKYFYREEQGASWNISVLAYSTNRAQVPNLTSIAIPF